MEPSTPPAHTAPAGTNTPFRKFKSTLYEGGIATPLIVSWPAGLKTKPGSLSSVPGYLTDIMPTVLEVSGAAYPKENHGQPAPPLQGRSLVPVLTASADAPAPRPFFREQYGYKAVREGNLKAVFAPPGLCDRSGRGQWELYDLSTDRTELNDLAADKPAELQNLIAQWDTWGGRSQVLDTPPAKPGKPLK